MYRNAGLILPPHLLREIQKYIEGQEIYIPKRAQTRLGWGAVNGTRAYLAERNRSIYLSHQNGADITQLMRDYHLGYDSVRKILQRERRANQY